MTAAPVAVVTRVVMAVAGAENGENRNSILPTFSSSTVLPLIRWNPFVGPYELTY
jgi:hypothetical protein